MEKTAPKDIPSVNKVIIELKKDSKVHESYLKKIIQDEIELYRRKIKKGELNKSSEAILDEIKYKVLAKVSLNLVNVINGTGIVLHTGFGRAPFTSKNLKKINSNKDIKKTNYINTKIENIRVIKGTNFDYFSEEGKKKFYEKEFTVSKLSDRMGMRLEGPKIDNIVNTNIKSEGLIKGVIQVPADGNPIIMLSDHGTIGGYPKIGVVASVDYDRLVQMSPGSKIKFKEINLPDAETLFKLYEMETQNLISQI